MVGLLGIFFKANMHVLFLVGFIRTRLQAQALTKYTKRRNNTEQCFEEYISLEVIVQCECNWVTDIK